MLILQFAPAVRGKLVPRFEAQLGVLLALLKQRGHGLSLLGLARHDEAPLKAALARSLPRLIYADISCVCVDAARRALAHIQQREFLPVIAGGAFAAAAPSTCLSLPGVQAVAVGEPDASLVAFLERAKDPAAAQVVAGVWTRDEHGLARPDLPPLIEALESLPFPERELFGYARRVESTGELEISTGRGCPQSCAYCRVPALGRLYQGRGQWVRRRPPENVLAEIDLLLRSYPAARVIRFVDHSFALDNAWLSEFLPKYKARCGLPFRAHLRANAVDAAGCSALAAAGCAAADVEVVSGSDFIRNEVFAMDLHEEQIVAALGSLREAGIRSRATFYLGAPYESEASLERTRMLIARIRPDVLDVRPYFPWPGTPAADLARENGWLHPRGETQYHSDRCGLDMPACRGEVVDAFIRRLRHEFPAASTEPWWRRWSQASRSALAGWFPRRAP